MAHEVVHNGHMSSHGGIVHGSQPVLISVWEGRVRGSGVKEQRPGAVVGSGVKEQRPGAVVSEVQCL